MQYPTIRQSNRGDAVKALQRLLHLKDDGIFGLLTTEALKEWQADHGLTPDGICGPKTWEKLLSTAIVTGKGPDEGIVTSQSQDDADVLLANVDLSVVRPATRRTITEIIVHCTATPDGKDFTVEDIKRWHLKRGFSDIGYHYVIYRDGCILSGRNVNTAGAHCTGHNTHSIGICYVGGMDAQNKQAADTRTEEQHKSMLALLRRLCKMYPRAKVMGHRELSPDKDGDGLVEPSEWIKDCPSFEVSTLRTELRKAGVYKA